MGKKLTVEQIKQAVKTLKDGPLVPLGGPRYYPTGFESNADYNDDIEAARSAQTAPSTAETCVSCGKVIPEGRQVCPICERKEHP